MAPRKKLETNPSDVSKSGAEPRSTVSINREALVSLAYTASGDRTDQLFGVFHEALDRIYSGRVPKGTTAKTVNPRGTHPNVLDLRRWLDSLTKKSPDAEFAVSVYRVLEFRASPSAIKSVQKG